jgi:hypothetical protein
VKNITSKYGVDDGEFTLVLMGEVTGDGPTDMQALQCIDHLLSALPGCNEVVKGAARKDAIVGKWAAWRSLS